MSDVAPTKWMRPTPRRQRPEVWTAYGILSAIGGFALSAGGLEQASGVGAVVGVLVAGIGYVQRRRLLDQNRRLLGPAAAPLVRGDLDTAEQKLRAVLAHGGLLVAVRTVAKYDLGLTLHRQGRQEEAIEQLLAADREGGASNVYPAIASTIACAHALLGDVETARLWLHASKTRYATVKSATPHPEIISEALVALRAGEAEDVAKRFARDWPELEATRKGETLRPLRVLHAFALAQSSGTREAGRVQRLLDALYPVRRAEFEYLGKSWPAMHDFLATSLPA